MFTGVWIFVNMLDVRIVTICVWALYLPEQSAMSRAFPKSLRLLFHLGPLNRGRMVNSDRISLLLDN